MQLAVRSERRWGDRTAEQRRAERRVKLTRAAIKVYGEKGYRNATVKAVCDAAGLTERYFYESFPNGEALLKHCFREVTGSLLSRMRTAAEDNGGTPLEGARAGLLVYLGELQADPAGARVFLFEMASVSPATEALVSESLDAFGALLVETLQRPREEMSPVSPLLLRGAVGGGLHIAQAWIASGYAANIEHVADDALRLYGLLSQPDPERLGA